MSFDRFMVARDAASNPKVKRMKRAGKETRWAWFHGVLAIAARAQPRGYLTIGDLPADEHDVADVADVTVAEARRAMKVGRDLGMLVRDDTTGWEFVHDWDEFNPAPRNDQTNAERQQRFRDRNAGRNGSNAPDNAPVTGSNAREVEGEGEEQQSVCDASASTATDPLDTITDERLTATVTILRTCPRLYFDVELMGVSNVLQAFPDADHVKAAHLTVAAASDPAYNTTDAGRALRYAIQGLDRPNGGGRPAAKPVREAKPWDGAVREALNERKDHAA